jgi:hypothetical protein
MAGWRRRGTNNHTKTRVLLDSGTSLIYFPRQAYSEFRTVFNMQVPRAPCRFSSCRFSSFFFLFSLFFSLAEMYDTSGSALTWQPADEGPPEGAHGGRRRRRLLAGGCAVSRCCLRVRVEIMRSQNCGIVGESQPVLMRTNPVIFTRTRMPRVLCVQPRSTIPGCVCLTAGVVRSVHARSTQRR